MYVGYGGKTDRPYASLGKAIIDQGIMTRDDMSLSGIKKLYKRSPELIEQLIHTNENYVFFTEYAGDLWPAGSLGVQVTRETSLATDKSIYPRGGLVLADTRAVTFSTSSKRFVRFMFDQDTGGAIKAPGRADIYMGEGNSAEILAGGQYAEGKLYYFFLKPQHVAQHATDSGSGIQTASVSTGR
ncbi:MAG: MltA domain-containing protein, partial [Planctomycetota bacterium]|nr:MltA domain-containing protein [Planctomycetota bacterium]